MPGVEHPVALGRPLHERVFRLDGRNRLDRVSAADRVRAGFRQAEMQNLARLDQVLDGAGDILDRHRRIHGDLAAAMGDAAISGAPAPEAGQVRPAIQAWLAAAKKALDRSANREAASYVERTFVLLELVPE